MRRSNVRLACLILFSSVIISAACAQNPPRSSQEYMAEERLVQKSMALLNNDQHFIPIINLDHNRMASVHFSTANAAGFDSLLNKYTKVDGFSAATYGDGRLGNLAQDLKLYNTIIVQLEAADAANPAVVNFILAQQKFKNVVVAAFGNGTMLNKLNEVTAPIIWTDRTTPVAAELSAQAIFGGIAITQVLTTNYSPKYTANSGSLTAKIRLQYTVPEDAGINSNNLVAIDNIAQEAITKHAAPGCVVLVIKDGKMIFNKAYGYHTYDNVLPDKITDIFDLASVTKVSATTMSTMRLTEQGKINLDSTVGYYLPIARNTSKSDIRVRELLLHQAGLIPDIPTYERLKPSDHSPDSSAAYPTKAGDHFYIRKDYFKDVMWPEMLASPLRTRGKYVYSDLSMYFMKEIVETVSAEPLNIYAQNNFYGPLGMQTAGFLPLNRFPVSRIIPTEQDTYFRHQLIDGYVHDQGAALLGGVSGHAGLFATANDLGILYQMILNKGTYGGVQYFKPETVTEFTSRYSSNSRRGLGFDGWGPLPDSHYPSTLASPGTYGHTGFTGTCFWVDPKYNLVYVFLSNRVYPRENPRLSSLNIRPRIQDAIYEAIQKGM